MEFSKLRGALAEKGFTQETMAKALGMDPKTFRAKMAGRSDWKMSEMYRMMQLLSNYDSDALFFSAYTSENRRASRLAKGK